MGIFLSLFKNHGGSEVVFVRMRIETRKGPGEASYGSVEL